MARCINCPRDAGDRMLCQSCRASGEALGLPLDEWLAAFEDAIRKRKEAREEGEEGA